MVAAGIGDLCRFDHQFFGDFTLQNFPILEPLVFNDRRTAGADAEFELISRHQFPCLGLGGDLDRQDQGKLGLRARHRAGRVLHDDLIAALGVRLHVGQSQGCLIFARDGLVVEQPLVSQRLAAGGVNREHGRRPLNPPCGIRLLHDGDGVINRDERFRTHDFAAFVRDGDMVHPGVGQLHAGECQFRPGGPL